MIGFVRHLANYVLGKVFSREETEPSSLVPPAIRKLDPIPIAAPWLSDEDNAGRQPLLQAADRLIEQYRLLVSPGQVVEVRALEVPDHRKRPDGLKQVHTEAGYYDFDHIPKMILGCLNATIKARGVYFTLNPVQPDLQERCANRLRWAKKGTLTGDTDIVRRQWLLVDCDPVRDPHDSATDEEKAAAMSVVHSVRDDLRTRGWPEPILSDSGNGYHLLYRIDLPAEDKRMVERILAALAAKHDTDRATVDRVVFNQSRICKPPGTWSKKGPNTPERPWRQASMLEVPAGEMQCVPESLLTALANEAPVLPVAQPHQAASSFCGTVNRPADGVFTSRLLTETWLRDCGRDVSVHSKNGIAYFEIDCPFHPDHKAAFTQRGDGKNGFHCFHNRCAGRDYQAAKAVVGKQDGRRHYDPPLTGPDVEGQHVDTDALFDHREPDAAKPPPQTHLLLDTIREAVAGITPAMLAAIHAETAERHASLATPMSVGTTQAAQTVLCPRSITVHKKRSVDRKTGKLLNDDMALDPPCKCWQCEVCGPIKKHQHLETIRQHIRGYGGRMWRFTVDMADWGVVSRAMQARSEWVAVPDGSHIERNHQGKGYMAYWTDVDGRPQSAPATRTVSYRTKDPALVARRLEADRCKAEEKAAKHPRGKPKPVATYPDGVPCKKGDPGATEQPPVYRIQAKQTRYGISWAAVNEGGSTRTVYATQLPYAKDQPASAKLGSIAELTADAAIAELTAKIEDRACPELRGRLLHTSHDWPVLADREPSDGGWTRGTPIVGFTTEEIVAAVESVAGFGAAKVSVGRGRFYPYKMVHWRAACPEQRMAIDGCLCKGFEPEPVRSTVADESAMNTEAGWTLDIDFHRSS